MVPGAGQQYPIDMRVQALEALLRAAEDLQTQPDEQGILRVIATRLTGVVPHDYGLSVYLISPDGQFLLPTYADGPYATRFLNRAPDPIPAAMVGSSAATERISLGGDARFSPDGGRVEKEWDAANSAINQLVVPLRSRKQVIGVLLIYRSPDWLFGPDDLSLAQLFANHAAIAIENTRLLERERERTAALQELNELRSDFVSTVSHELRTPLTSIIGFTESLQGYWGRMNEEKKLEMLNKIHISSLRLERMVRDLLVISRVEAGDIPLRLEPLDVAELVSAAIQEISGKYRGEHIVVVQPATPVAAVADGDRLVQVIVNLLDNAIKYSPEGSPVTVRWEAQGATLVLHVEDRGCGIAAENLPRLFTRFGKIGTAIRSGHVGTGLGLYISHGLVTAMKGQISVQSTPGHGSIFTVTLPRASARPG
jgi:signal transduction histidine kinase